MKRVSNYVFLVWRNRSVASLGSTELFCWRGASSVRRAVVGGSVWQDVHLVDLMCEVFFVDRFAVFGRSWCDCGFFGPGFLTAVLQSPCVSDVVYQMSEVWCKWVRHIYLMLSCRDCSDQLDIPLWVTTKGLGSSLFMSANVWLTSLWWVSSAIC